MRFTSPSLIRLPGFCFTVLIAVLVASLSAAGAELESLGGSLYLFRDSCNVYVLEEGGHTLAIDLGSGDVLDAIQKRGWQAPDWVLFTHHHRDQCQGSGRLPARARIAAPSAERAFFESADAFWQRVRIFNNYRFKPDFFTPTFNIPVARALSGGDVLTWRGMEIKAIATPGHTLGHLAYAASVDGRRVVWSGDVIHSPGKVWNFHALEYGYNDRGTRGLGNLRKSRDAILAESPDLLLPSHGVAMDRPAEALDAMLANLGEAVSWLRSEIRPGDPCEPLPHLRKVKTVSNGYLIASGDGNAFLVDAGDVNPATAVEASPDLDRIDVIWPSHYHGDHTFGINKLQARYGSQVYCQEILRDVLATPGAWNIPCLIPEPIIPDRVLRDGEKFEWRGISMQAFFFPGQTQYHEGLLATIDGKRVFFTGDSLDGPEHGHNYNCRNYIQLEPDGGMLRCAEVLEAVKPDVLATGHWGIWKYDAEKSVPALREWAEGLRPRFERLIAWDDPNFGMDENWVSVFPYQNALRPGETGAVEARIRNHSSREMTLVLELDTPDGMSVKKEVQTTRIPAKGEGTARFRVRMERNAADRRHVATLNVVRGGQNLGPLAECIFTRR